MHRLPARKTRRSVRLAGTLLGCVCVYLALPSTSRAFPVDDWEVMRIFITDPKQLSNLVPPNYLPVEIEDLAQRLAEEARRREAALLDVPKLEEALYVARLEKGALLSEQSRWVFSGNTKSQPMSVGDISVALRRALGIKPDKDQLLDNQLITSGGDLQLNLSGGRVERWFGFSVLPGDPATQTFDLRLPLTVSARMLIATPANIALQSKDVVVQKIVDPVEYLPQDWSTAEPSLFAGNSGRQWWLLNLSGVARFELRADTVDEPSQNWFKHTLRAADIDYIATDGLLDVKAKFLLASDLSEPAIRLRLSNELRVSSVLINGVSAGWRIQPSLSGDSNLVAIEGQHDRSSTLLVEVSASQPFEFETDTTLISLPELAIAESFAIRGRTRVFSDDHWVVDHVTSSDSSCEMSSAVLGPRPAGELSNLHWTLNWLGVNPSAKGSFSRRVQSWTGRSLTRFVVQNDWLSAVCRIQLESKNVDTNEIRLSVGAGWFVDKVTLVGNAPSDLQANLVEGGTEQEPVTEIHASWEQRRKSLFFELEVMAHRPQKTTGESVRLFSRRLLTLADADQVDNYVIEQSGRYQLQLGADFLRFQLQPLDLPVWQQQLLPQLSDKWIFQGIRRIIPPVDLVASQGSYSTQTFTVVNRDTHGDSQDVAVEYWIRVQPISGTVNAITVTAPKSIDASALHWEQVSQSDTTAIPTTALVTPRSDGSTTIVLELQQPLATAFNLRCTTKLTLADGGYSVAVFGLPQAITSDSLLLTPRELAHFNGHASLEVLPPAACCDDFDTEPWLGESNSSMLTNHVAARLDAGVEQTVRVNVTQDSDRAPGWISEETIEHWMEAGSKRTHVVQWQIEVIDDPLFEFNLPSDWQVESVAINGVQSRVAEVRNGSFQFELPTRQRSDIILECSSSVQREAWLTREVLQAPEVTWDVYSSHEILHVPPHKAAMTASPSPTVSRRLVDRLVPSRWWNWLSPESLSADNPRANRPGWTTIQTVKKEVDGHWIVDRAALAGVALACVNLAVVFFWVTLRKSVRLSWLLGGTIAVALVVVPSHLVGPLQLLLLSAVLSGLLRLAQVVVRTGSSTHRKRSVSRTTKLSVVRGAVVTLMLGLQASPGFAQFSSGISRPFDSTAETLQPPEIFGVLIPVDESGNVVSTYAYVPPLLHHLLNDPNSSLNGAFAPRLLSADYALRTNPTNSLERELVQEFTAEYRVFVGRADSELRLPFLMSELPISRSEINGQSELFGDHSVRQESTAVIFRAKMPGTYLLKLYFKPLVVIDDGGQARLQVQIPAIPSANLRVVSDATTRTEVRSVGRQTRSGNEINVALGALDELDCRWISGQEGFVSPQSVVVNSNLWINAHETQLAAAAMLRIQNPSGLPELFHIVADNNWEPIGSQWRDVELISSESTSVSNRRIYTVRLTSEFLRSIKKEAVIGMLMAPKTRLTTSSIPLPFLSLQEVGQSTTRTLTWSATNETPWMPDGIGPQILSVEGEVWGELALAKEFVSYRVATNSQSSSLQRKTPSAIELVNEFSRVHLSLAEARIQYRAQWLQARDGSSGLRFEVPRSVRVESVLVNGNATDYQLGRQAGHEVLLVAPRLDISSVDTVELELTFPIALGRKAALRRVLLLDSTANSSILQLTRSTGLDCQFEQQNALLGNQLSLDTISSRPKELLENLEVSIGQIELGNSYRDSGELPLDFTLNLRAEPVQAKAVIYVERNEQGAWFGRLESEWQAGDKPVDFAFFDLPSHLRDTIDAGQLPRRIIPTGDSSRIVLCVMFPEPSPGPKRVTLNFALNTTPSNQSIVIPRIQPLAENPVTPVLALPRMVDSQLVAWGKGGPPVDADWTDPFVSQDPPQFEYFNRDPVQLQAAWRTLDRIDRTSRILLTRVTLDAIEDTYAVGSVNYWVQPRGQLALQFEIPEGMRVIGARVGEQNANTISVAENSLAVLLQPNYLPVNVSLLVRWQRAGENQLPLPKPKLGATSDNPSGKAHTLIELPDNLWQLTHADVESRPLEFMAETWVNTIVNALPIVTGLTLAERVSWLQSWHPALIGLEDGDLVSVDADASPADDAELNSTKTLQSVSEFWQGVCDQLSIEREAVTMDVPERSPTPRRALTGRRVYLLNHSSIHVKPIVETHSIYPQLIAGGLLALVVLLSFRLGTQVRDHYFAMLAAHPWVYWVQLAALAWIFIPAVWPSIVILMTAIGMGLSQLMESRRATQYR